MARAKRAGILIYVSPEDHQRLKLKAVQDGTTLQALGERGLLRSLEPARKTDRSELTEWERAARDIDSAEWELLDARQRGDTERLWQAEDHLARCQTRVRRLLQGTDE